MPVLAELNLYPIKSCAGIALRAATLTAAGLATDMFSDREWMVVDANGEFLTQREHPKMALIKPLIKRNALSVRAPGMPILKVPLWLPEDAEPLIVNVRVWNDTVEA
jgi:uncharacterized protein YcbX